MRKLILALFLCSSISHADLSGGGLTDYYGNPITSNPFAGARAAMDVETVVSGNIVDPRARTWTLLNSTDSVNAVQSGAWTTGRTWTLLNTTDSVNSVQSGTWTTGRTWTLASGTDSATVVQGTSPWVTNITQFGGVALATGTGSSGTGIPRVTVSNDSNILATQSGTWTVQQGATPTAVANAWPIKLTDGTNTTAVKAASAAAAATDPSAVVALSPNSPLPTGTNNVGSITNVTGTVSLPTGAATLAAQNTGNASLASIDAGIPVALGAATIANSMPVNIASDQVVPISGTQLVSGAQKTQVVDGAGAVVGPVFPMNGVNYAPVSFPTDFSATTVNITVVDSGTATSVGYANQSMITGTPTANSFATYALNTIQTVMVIIKGTWTGTLQIEVSSDGGTTYEPRSIHVVGTPTFSSAITANAVGSLNASAKTQVRIRATAAITGTANVAIVESDNPSNVYVANSIKIIDGSSTLSTNQLTVKAASTPPVSTDMATVVALSSNFPVLTGTTGTAVSVGTSSTATVASNTNRAGLILVNTSNAIESCTVGTAVLRSGVTLYPGGSWEMSINSFTTGAISCIASAAASNISIQEFTK